MTHTFQCLSKRALTPLEAVVVVVAAAVIVVGELLKMVGCISLTAAENV